MPELITTIPLFSNYDDFIAWCLKVRTGEIKTTPDIRNKAKMATYAIAYGMRTQLLEPRR